MDYMHKKKIWEGFKQLNLKNLSAKTKLDFLIYNPKKTLSKIQKNLTKSQN
jgi:hypothetical protein